MSDNGEVKLEYALRGDSLLHISDFAHMRGDLNSRPRDLTCPECNSDIIPVLPPSYGITDHFRHQSENSCRLSGESALHFNAKVALAQEMSKFRQAPLVYQCRPCGNWYPFLQIGPYDRVIPEMKVSARRPDVTCLNGAGVVGIAEIFHRHAVDFEKKNDLNAIGCPWFEIPAINVHRQFFKFVEAADIFSIDAAGAGITYPVAPTVCEVCDKGAAQRAKLWSDLRKATDTALARDLLAQRPDLGERRRAEAERVMRRDAYAAFVKPNSPESVLVAGCKAEGIIPDIDQHGIRITIGTHISGPLWIAIAAYRTRNRKGRK